MRLGINKSRLAMVTAALSGLTLATATVVPAATAATNDPLRPQEWGLDQVHAEQAFELHRPLPLEGTVRTVSTVTGIYDKGAGALVETENVAADAATGQPLVTSRSAAYIRGEGGFGSSGS